MIANLDKYDSGYWSYYDQTGRIASPAYHQLHIALLKVMKQITGRNEFLLFAEKWSEYERKPLFQIRAITKK